MSAEDFFVLGGFCVVFIALILIALFPDRAEAFFSKLYPEPETPPDEPRYYAFTVISEHNTVSMMYIMGDHPLLWIEHERRRARRTYYLLAVHEMPRPLWDAIEEKVLVEIDDKPMGTRRRLREPSL